MQRTFFRTAALLAMISVILGAFGAHALKALITEQALASFHTATTYMMTHAIALFIVGMMYRHYKNKTMVWSGNFFVMGIIMFSGSIYLRIALSYLGYEKLDVINLITPVGGLMFILGWLLLFISIPPREHLEKATKSDD
ncbi:MAG: DUF423 domain-containing protein [bacterium]|jgi:uncharacterized membrane protein YgdD (TMEM256/DUF423 family)|nr:DUF423 domain-containing protein [Chitinophagaceae bacterium]